MMAPARPQDEDGAVLVVTLIFLSVWALVIGAVLTFSEVGFETIADARDRTANTYSSESALETGLAYLATSPDVRCADEVGEFGDELLTVNANGRSVRLECREFPMPGGVRRVDLMAEAMSGSGPSSVSQVSATIDHSVSGPGGSGAVTIDIWVVTR